MLMTMKERPNSLCPVMYDVSWKGGVDGVENSYELHFLLMRLRAGDLTFEQFLTQAKAWAENQVQR